VDSLGRFLSPVVCGETRAGRIIFDRGSSYFYAIDFDVQKVHRGPRIADMTFRPVDVVTSKLGPGVCSVDGRYSSSVRDEDVTYATNPGEICIPVVDESGAIAVLDLRSWNLITRAGHLPAPRTSYGRGSSRPENLFDYDVKVIIKRPENEYAGLMIAALPRAGVPLTVCVFNRDGHLIGETPDRAAIGPWLTTKHLIESLHPPVLTLASFFTAYSFDAGATHRVVFLMPNSFVAQQRDRQTSFLFQLLWALVFMLPAMLFAGFLSWRVAVDARVIGLSAWARRVWMAGTFAFGLPAYITYRLMRPRCVLMVCRDCGRGRRLDRDVCHHCGRGWDSPELEPPAWRVIGPPKEGRAAVTQAE
jgi:hypothetical protein